MSEKNDFELTMPQKDVQVISRITTKADAPYNQRALAILAINEGKTAAAAAESTGLRPTQVSYWVTRYQKSGLAIFPQDLLAEEVDVVEMETAVSPAMTTLAQAPSPQKEETKKKKPKGGKNKESKGEKQAAAAAVEEPPDNKEKQKKSKDSKKTKKDKKSNKKKKDVKKE
ncbi:MAG: helix-turn-helix domain-containing protein, partial [Anaerolineae bacterium]|nr:helix-turn-helix domain-containing protein [Anaerolineae bacterium]